MRTHLKFWQLIPCISLALVTLGLADDDGSSGEERLKVEYKLIFPDEKGPELVKPEEDNPFVALSELNTKEDVGNSEENVIKDKLLSLSVVGVSPRADGYKVQLGDLILYPGLSVPPFIPDQTVRLRVNTITENQIEFVWVERQRTGLPPRTLVVPIRIRPSVRSIMPGQKRDTEGGKPLLNATTPQMGSNHNTEELVDLNANPAPRPEVVNELPGQNSGENAGSVSSSGIVPVRRTPTQDDSLLDMFFNQGAKIPTPE